MSVYLRGIRLHRGLEEDPEAQLSPLTPGDSGPDPVLGRLVTLTVGVPDSDGKVIVGGYS